MSILISLIGEQILSNLLPLKHISIVKAKVSRAAAPFGWVLVEMNKIER